MTRRPIPRTVLILGLVSLSMDVSSELVHSLLPLLLVNVLHASALTFGVIEGVAEATTAVTRLFSGALSDWWGRRKPLLLAGYGLAALTRLLFPLADSAATVFAARLLDRFGKGLRAAPRDALVADVTPPERRGAAYGLRQSLDSVGAGLGPLAALGLMLVVGGDPRQAFWFALLPAAVAVALLGLIREPRTHVAAGRRVPISRGALAALPASYWFIVGVAAVFTLARFSEGFLLLRGQQAGLPMTWVPLVLVVMNAAYLSSAYPLGRLADRIDRRWLLGAGVVLLAAANVTLAVAERPATVLFAALLWGGHLGATQGVLAAIVGDAAPATLRGTAFGVFSLANGIALLGASTLAGALWSTEGPAATFVAGALLAVGAGGTLLVGTRRRAA